jgi:hypothetical protein
VLVFGRVARTSISREGRAWWVLKSAPISGHELLGGKLLAAAVPFAVVSTLLTAGAAVWNGYSVAGALYGWYGIEVLGAGMLALNVACSVPWAKLDWDDPRRMSSGWATIASWASSAALGVLGGLFLCLPLLAEAFAPSMVAPAWIVGAGAALAISAGASALALQFGVSRLPLVGEA